MLWGDRETGRRSLGWLVGLLVVAAQLASVSAASKRELLVAAAISLKEPLQEIGVLFEQRYPGAKVVFNWGASGTLQQQIEHGAPVDVYVSASARQMDEINAKGLLINETRRTFAANHLVLIISPSRHSDITSFRDLTKSEVKLIAIGNPRTVPAGQYARSILMGLGLWDSLQSKLIFTGNVRQALAYVVQGEVEAAIVYATDAQHAGTAVQVVAAAPEETAPPVLYPIAALRTSKQIPEAKAFVDLALSDAGQRILRAHGFLPPPKVPAH